MAVARATKLFLLDLCTQIGVLLVVFGMAFVFLSATKEIDAQIEATDSAQSTQSQVFLADDQLNLDLAEVKRSYRGQLEEYRTLYQQFIVAKQEFQQLGTLSSLEAGVQATQKVMVMRDQVLLSYLKILEIETELSTVLDPSLASDSLFLLSETQKSITRHLEDTQAASDRASIAQQVVAFEELEELYSFTVAFSKQLLQLGELRQSHNQAQDILSDLPLEIEGQSELRKAARARALDQISLNLLDSEASLDQTELELRESLEEASLTSTADAYEDVYAILQRVAGFLEEVHLPQQ